MNLILYWLINYYKDIHYFLWVQMEGEQQDTAELALKPDKLLKKVSILHLSIHSEFKFRVLLLQKNCLLKLRLLTFISSY